MYPTYAFVVGEIQSKIYTTFEKNEYISKGLWLKTFNPSCNCMYHLLYC